MNAYWSFTFVSSADRLRSPNSFLDNENILAFISGMLGLLKTALPLTGTHLLRFPKRHLLRFALSFRTQLFRTRRRLNQNTFATTSQNTLVPIDEKTLLITRKNTLFTIGHLLAQMVHRVSDMSANPAGFNL